MVVFAEATNQRQNQSYGCLGEVRRVPKLEHYQSVIIDTLSGRR